MKTHIEQAQSAAGGWLGGTIVFVHGMRVRAVRETASDDEDLSRHTGGAA